MSRSSPNTDPFIRPLRILTQSVYKIAFELFPILENLVNQLSSQLQKSSNKLLKDDIEWIKNSILEDSNKFIKLKSHIAFLNAEETLTTQREILTVFKELIDFLELILLDDLIVTLKNLNETLSDSKDKSDLIVNGYGFDEIVENLTKFKISFQITTKPIKSLVTSEIGDEKIFHNQEELLVLQQHLQQRLVDLDERLKSLKEIVQG